MRRVANQNARYEVNNLTEFNGNNTFAGWKNGTYVVYSYGYHFPMYAYRGGQWYGNADKYSVTTSKHQSQLRPSGDIEWLDTEQMKKIPYMDIVALKVRYGKIKV